MQTACCSGKCNKGIIPHPELLYNQKTDKLKAQPSSSHKDINRDIKKISTIFVFIAVFMTIELWGHIKTRSLSLLADAIHLLVDISGFIVSIITLRLSKRKPDTKMTFGYGRAEIIGALFSVFFIWAAVLYLMAESIHKYLHPKEIDGKTFLIIAIAGLFVNIVCIIVLHFDGGHCHHHGAINGGCAHLSDNNESSCKRSEKKNLNMRATYIHVIGDIIQSVGVLIASIIIYIFPSAVITDVLCTVFFAGLVLYSTYFVVGDAIRILSEGTPKGVEVDEIKEKILKMPKVIKITDIKTWSISVNKMSIAIKILMDGHNLQEYEVSLKAIKDYLRNEKEFEFVNIQVDTPLTIQKISGSAIEGISIKNIL